MSSGCFGSGRLESGPTIDCLFTLADVDVAGVYEDSREGGDVISSEKFDGSGCGHVEFDFLESIVVPANV